MIVPFFEGEVAPAVSSEVALQNLGLGRDEASLQIDITGAATVVIQGKLSQTADWISIKTVTESEIQPIYRVPYLRMEITQNSGSVSAFISS